MKKEKELEITRLRAQQERAKDYKADQVWKKEQLTSGIIVSEFKFFS